MIVLAGYEGADLLAIERIVEVTSSSGVSVSSYSPQPPDTETGARTSLELPALLRTNYPRAEAYRSFFEKTHGTFSVERIREAKFAMAEIQPSVVVWCVGQPDGLIARQAALELGIPVVSIVTPFYEFKALQPFSCPGNYDREWFVCAGPCGRRRLIASGAAPGRIRELGAPSFEAPTKLRTGDNQPSILAALQSESDEPLLLTRLRIWCDANSALLVTRGHPGLAHLQAGEQAAEWDTLDGALERASVVVSRNSLVLLHALLRGIPAICWQDKRLPCELLFANPGLKAANGITELETALAVFSRKDGDFAEEISQEASRLFADFGESAANRIFEFLRDVPRLPF